MEKTVTKVAIAISLSAKIHTRANPTRESGTRMHNKEEIFLILNNVCIW